jgi:UDP-N-acetylmuramoyl-L-alanyl-D-glutamate--2,6-diaminopimelate ligase
MSSAVTLGDLVREGLGRLAGPAEVELFGVQHDSRAVTAGDLFVAVPGANVDGARFAEQAIARGAVAVAAERALDLDVPQLLVDDARGALGRLASAVYRQPTYRLAVVGITGTNGKTTTAWLVESVIAHAGGRPALMGTVTFRGPGIELAAPHTTPEGDDLARFARRVLDAGATHLVMEVSSHALALRRVDAVRFRVAAFTNLTQDHLDFHGDLRTYGEAKARLFLELGPGHAVINVDDPFGAELATKVHGPLLRCSARAHADAEIRAREWSMTREGIRAAIETPDGEVSLESPLVGAHNLENLLLATGCGLALGFPAGTVTAALRHARGAPGRLERVDDPRDVAVLVDYAHTPDALANALAALRPVTPGRLIALFGCGGDRDRGKRPHMGEAAARGADLCVVTSDNPRTERPSAIIDEILPGVGAVGQPELTPDELAGATRGYVVIEDRAEAIRHALSAARAGDTVLIAGKGHEDYQIVGTEKRPFDDRDHARAAIAAALGGGA